MGDAVRGLSDTQLLLLLVWHDLVNSGINRQVGVVDETLELVFGSRSLYDVRDVAGIDVNEGVHRRICEGN